MADKPIKTVRLADLGPGELKLTHRLTTVKPILLLVERYVNDGLLKLNDSHLDFDAGDYTVRLILTSEESIRMAASAVDDAMRELLDDSDPQSPPRF